MVRETRHLWVGNLPDNIREDRIKEHFKRYGPVQNVKLLAKGVVSLPGALPGLAEAAAGAGALAGAAAAAAAAPPSGLCAAVAFMDIKSAAKAHGEQHTMDERPLTTVYYEPAAIPSSASAGSSPAGSGYSASSGSVNSAARYPLDRHQSSAVVGLGAGVAGSLSLSGGAGGGAAASAVVYAPAASDRARPRDRVYRNEPSSYTNNLTDRSSHHRWYLSSYAASPSAMSGDGSYAGGTIPEGGKAARARSGSSSPASNSSRSRSPSSSSAPRSASSSSSRDSSAGANTNANPANAANSTTEHRRKHQWSSSSRPLAICVRNLPQRSSDSSLKDGLFHEYKKHGKVSCVKVVGVNQERYAVVCFKKPSDVEKALEESHDKSFFGCKISVGPYQGMDVEDNESRPYETDLDEFHPKATRTLFIGNLEKEVTSAQLREKFKQFGKIIEIDIKKQTGGAAGYAFCQYANISSVVNAIRSMDGEHVGGSRVKLGFGKSMVTNCVWIDGVTEQSEKQVFAHCTRIGPIAQVSISNGSSGHALVVFEQVAAAQQAVKELRGLSVRGRKLQVDFASRECQEAFYERDKQYTAPAALAECRTDRFTDIPVRGFDSPLTRYSRYETGTRTRTIPYNRSASSRSARFLAQTSGEHFDLLSEFPDRRFRYDEFSGGSGSEAAYDAVTGGSVGVASAAAAAVVGPGAPSLQSSVVVVGAHPPNMRHLQKERVHLLEQLEECASSGDELVSPKKKFKIEKASLGRRPSGENVNNRHHREISPFGKRRRGSEASRHHWRSPSPVSRPGTPLHDERPDSPPPSEPRRLAPSRRLQPMSLPLPRFAAQVLARVPPCSPPLVPSGPPPPASPPAIPLPRIPSPVSSPGSSPSTAEPSLDERIRSLDERYEKWSGSRVSSTLESQDRSRFRHHLLDLDPNEVQPSEVMRSVLAKHSVFDEDSKRLESICDKYENPPKLGCAFPSPSAPLVSPSPLNSPQSAGRSPFAGSPGISVPKAVQAAVVAPAPAPPVPPPAPIVPIVPLAPAKGLQYPFPSHPPSSLTPEGVPPTPPVPPLPPAPSETPAEQPDPKQSVAERLSLNHIDSVHIPRSNSSESSASDRIAGGADTSTLPAETKLLKSQQHFISKHPPEGESDNISENELTIIKNDEKTKCSAINSDNLDRRKSEPAEIPSIKGESESNVPDLKDQSFKHKSASDKASGDKKCSENKTCPDKPTASDRRSVDFNKLDYKQRSTSLDKPPSETYEKRKTSRDERERAVEKDSKHVEHESKKSEKVDSQDDTKPTPHSSSEKSQNHPSKKEDPAPSKERFSMEHERREKERKHKEDAEKEKAEKEKLDRERRDKEKHERERLERERKERLELEKERSDKERRDRERQEKDKMEKERREKERLEKDRREKERSEKEKAEKAAKEKLEKEKLEIEKEKEKEKERCTKERAEKDKSEKDKSDRLQETKSDKHERRKERSEKESKRKEDKDSTDNHEVQVSSRDKKRDREEHATDKSDSNRHRHKDSHRKEINADTKKDNGRSHDYLKNREKKVSKDESPREMIRKDSSDSTTSRNSHDSSRSKDQDIFDIKEESSQSRHSSKSKHSHENHKSRTSEKEYTPKSIVKEEPSPRSEAVKSSFKEKLKSSSLDYDKVHNNVVDSESKEKRNSADDKPRHYSLDSHNESRSHEHKRKERLNSSCSLPANVGLKRRVSSQDSLDLSQDDIKRPRLASERRDSKDSSKHSDKNRHYKSGKNNLSKQLEDKIKDDKKCIKEEVEPVKIKEPKEKDAENDNKESVKQEIELSIKTEPNPTDADDKDSKNKIKIKKPPKPIENIEIKVEDVITDPDKEREVSLHKAFLARLELRSSEEDEKQRAMKKEMKEKKRLQQLEQIQQLQMQQNALQLQEGKKNKLDERKKDIKDKRISNERKSRDECPLKLDIRKKPRKLTNSSDTSDSDEPKKHSIFDIEDDGPAYISMYDKVKARSCKNMQKQEEEKRQEKIKAKFSQLKQSRAKREEKKRSNSWDEDSDSDRDQKKSSCKSILASSSEDELRRQQRDLITTDSENDHKYPPPCNGENGDYTCKKIISRKNSRSRIVSDTSDDDLIKKNHSKLITDISPDKETYFSDMNLMKQSLLDIKVESRHLDGDTKPFNNENMFSEKDLKAVLDSKKAFEHLQEYQNTDFKSEALFNSDVKYIDIKPAHCDISSEGEGVISDNVSKLNSFLDIRKKHKKKQKRQKSFPSDDEAKSDFHEKMQIINNICNAKNNAQRKHANKKDKKRDKAKNDIPEMDDSNLKKPKKIMNNLDARSDSINNFKRGGKMQDIFGPFSDESDVGHKDFNTDLQNSKDKLPNNQFFASQRCPSDSDSICNDNSKLTNELIIKDKIKDDIHKEKRKDRKRKERKSIIKDDDNSLDVDAAGKAIEASLFDSLSEMPRPPDKVMTSTSLEPDVFRFTDGDDSRESSLASNHRHASLSKREGKERKKKKKKNKEDRQSRKEHHHHHHYDRHEINHIDKDVPAVPDTPTTDPDIITITDSKPDLLSPSLPSLIDSPPPAVKPEGSPQSDSPVEITEEIPTPLNTKTVKSNTPCEPRRLSDKFIPGFGSDIDETISESAVKSISEFDTTIADRKDPPKENIVNLTLDCSPPKPEEKSDEKPRAVISQEETEDAVAALLGESFGARSGGFADCYSENTQSPSAQNTTASPEATATIPDEEAEEMRQAVKSLNASELEIKPDTPQSENDLQIDTDTDEGEDVRTETKTEIPTTCAPTPVRTFYNAPIISKLPSLVESTQVTVLKPISEITDEKLKEEHHRAMPQLLETIQISGNPTNILSKRPVNHNLQGNEQPLLIAASSLQDREDKPVHITSILHLKPIAAPLNVSGQARPLLGAAGKISASYQVLNQLPRPSAIFNTQPPTIKIPDQHVMYQRQSGIVISPRMSGDNRLLSPKTEMPSKVTNMTILTAGPPTLNSPPGVASLPGMQQRSPGQITVVRMQQPPLSPIKTNHMAVTHQNRTVLSPNSNNVVPHNQNPSGQLNRLPVAPVLAPISKPLLSTAMNVQQVKTITANNPANIYPPKLTESGNKRVGTEIPLVGPKMIFSPTGIVVSQNSPMTAPNIVKSAMPPASQNPVSPGSHLKVGMNVSSMPVEKLHDMPHQLNGPDLVKIVHSNYQPMQSSTNIVASSAVIQNNPKMMNSLPDASKQMSPMQHAPHQNIIQRLVTNPNTAHSVGLVQKDLKKDNIQGIVYSSAKPIPSDMPINKYNMLPLPPGQMLVASNPSQPASSVTDTTTQQMAKTLETADAAIPVHKIFNSLDASLKEPAKLPPPQDQEITNLPKPVYEKPKCETDFEELLKQTASESKIEKPVQIKLLTPSEPEQIKTEKNIMKEESIKVEEALSKPNVETVIDKKENIVVKVQHIDTTPPKVVPIETPREINTGVIPDKQIDIKEPTKEVTGLFSMKETEQSKEKLNIISKPDNNNYPLDETLESLDEKGNPKIISKRGGRGRGRRVQDRVTERVQTRQGSKPVRGALTAGRRGRGRVKTDRKSRAPPMPGNNMPGDVYDFHEDSGDEASTSPQSKSEPRPRLILTIKSPNAANITAAPTTVVASVPPVLTNVSPKEPLPLSVGKTMPASPSQPTVRDEKSDDFVSPAANTRKSRRLLEKDVTRSSVDDIIEDVVKNSSVITPNRNVLSPKDSGPVRRSTRQNIKPTATGADSKKSRPGKKPKDRRTSETSVDSSDEKTYRKDPLEISDLENKSPLTPDASPKTELSDQGDLSIGNLPGANKAVKKNDVNDKPDVESAPAHAEKTEVIQKLPVDETCKPVSSAEAVKDSSKPSSESAVPMRMPIDTPKITKNEASEEVMLDPATGELVYMRCGTDGKLVAVPLASGAGKPAAVMGMSVPQTLPCVPIVTTTVLETPATPAETSIASRVSCEVQASQVIVKPQPSPSVTSQAIIEPEPEPIKLTTVVKSIIQPTTRTQNIIVQPIRPPVESKVNLISPNIHQGMNVMPRNAELASPSHMPNDLSGYVPKVSLPNPNIPMSHSQLTSGAVAVSMVIAKPNSATSKPSFINQSPIKVCKSTSAVLVNQGTMPKQVLLVEHGHPSKSMGGNAPLMTLPPKQVLSSHQPPTAQPKIGVTSCLPNKQGLPGQQMKPVGMPPQPLLAHPSQKKVMLVGGQVGVGALGPGVLGPSLPRGAQGQHASPPLSHMQAATGGAQPIIAGANSSRIGLTTVPSISPQNQIALGEGVYPHFSHHPYQQYFRVHQDARATPSPYVARSPLGAEGSEAPSPPLELRRLPGARVPHPAHSPALSDRSSDSPQVVSAGMFLGRMRGAGGGVYGEAGGEAAGRYYEAPAPPPAHAPPRLQHLQTMPHHRTTLSHTPNLSVGIGVDGGSAGEERGPSRGCTPAQGSTGLAQTPPGPPHAAHAPREADSLMMLLRRYPVMWQGLLALKNDAAAVQMHFVHGNPAVASHTLPSNGDGSNAPLRIAQRMRLEPVQLEAVARKMQMENEHCMLLALPCGRDHLDVLQQSTHLTGGFITYLRRKQAAGIVNIAPPGHHQPLYTVHIFPSCDFANENLERIAPDLLHRVADIAHLLIVIATV